MKKTILCTVLAALLLTACSAGGGAVDADVLKIDEAVGVREG